LFLITGMALVMGVVMTQVDTSVRATVGLRDETSTVYGADGAAQYAINKLRSDSSGLCQTSTTSFALNNFVPAANGNTSGPSSAYVACTPDSSNLTGGSATDATTSPGTALLALDSNLGEDGITANVNAGPVKIRGAIYSNSRINAGGGLANVWTPPASNPNGKTYNIARGACLPSASSVGVIAGNGTTTCNAPAADSRGQDPGTLTPHGASYDLPAAPSGNGTIGGCTGGAKFQTVTPGRFTDATALSNLSGCSKNVVWFQPGTYYFDFTAANTTWSVPSTFVIAGTPTIPLTSTPTAADMPTACVGPGDAGATTTSGVEFVFGGNSKLAVNNSAGSGSQLTICASNSSNGPPMAVYGLKSALAGAFPVAAESVCPPPGTSCALIVTGNSPKTTLTIRGLTYAPRAFIAITLNNNTKKVFYWGLIAYAISFTGTGSADVSNALVDVPDTAANPVPVPTTSYLDVYICAGASSCSASGALLLRAKVEISPTTPKTVKILSWSQR
jgi:hypothetical protein